MTIQDTVSSSSGNNARWTGAMKVGKQAGYGPGDWDSVTYIASFDASRSSAVYGRDKATEVRPKNVALLYCVKK